MVLYQEKYAHDENDCYCVLIRLQKGYSTMKDCHITPFSYNVICIPRVV